MKSTIYINIYGPQNKLQDRIFTKSKTPTESWQIFSVNLGYFGAPLWANYGGHKSDTKGVE